MSRKRYEKEEKKALSVTVFLLIELDRQHFPTSVEHMSRGRVISQRHDNSLCYSFNLCYSATLCYFLTLCYPVLRQQNMWKAPPGYWIKNSFLLATQTVNNAEKKNISQKLYVQIGIFLIVQCPYS